MIGKFFFIFALCINLSVLFSQSQDRLDLRLSATPNSDLVFQALTYLFQLDETAKPYCQRYSKILPIWCSNCKKRTLALADFPALLSALILKNVADKKEAERLMAVFEKFLKILTSPDTQEATLADFVLQEMKKLDYECEGCHHKSWEKIPEGSTKP